MCMYMCICECMSYMGRLETKEVVSPLELEPPILGPQEKQQAVLTIELLLQPVSLSLLQGLAMKPRMTLVLKIFHISLPSAGFIGMYH